MSLIHDSLRRLETNQVKSLDTGFNSHESSFSNGKYFSAKKLWILLVVTSGVILIIYAYTMLSQYQKQNEVLLKDINQIKSQNVQTQYASAKPKQQLPAKVIVQTPVAIVKKPSTGSSQQVVDKLVIQKPVVINTQAKAGKNREESNPSSSNQNDYAKTVALISQPKNNVKINKPVSIARSKTSKKKRGTKLSVRQSRQLVNNLQMYIESGNQLKADELLKKLAQSSGEESIVYLRMKAYNSTKNSDNVLAIQMYKKILFQKPYDIQAGTNLALLEAKNNQLAQAVKRLKSLKKRYPANKSISGYLERLEVN
ncbi:MAG: hypothetical protein L3J83_00305 [Proteobacteria bacterium]|nr:hypothetical protein [Pseudomonadota bacterium]